MHNKTSATACDLVAEAEHEKRFWHRSRTRATTNFDESWQLPLEARLLSSPGHLSQKTTLANCMVQYANTSEKGDQTFEV